MALKKYVKAATDRKRAQIDYTDWLDTGELVLSVDFTVDGIPTSPPLVIDDIMVLPSGLGVQYYVSGGVDGVTYRVLANLTTNTGPQMRLDEIIMTIREP